MPLVVKGHSLERGPVPHLTIRLIDDQVSEALTPCYTKDIIIASVTITNKPLYIFCLRTFGLDC